MSSSMTGIGAASARGEAKDENATLVPPIPEKFYGNVKRTMNGHKSKYLKINLKINIIALKLNKTQKHA